MIDEKAERICKKFIKLESDRVNWDSHWRELAEYIIPNKDNVYKHDRTKGEKKFSDLYDATGVHSNELLASALHGMLTNPTTPFFGLTTGIPEIDQLDDVRKWMQDTVRTMHNVLNNSNFQTEIHEVYLDMGSFGTGCLRIEEDDEDHVRFMSTPIYETYIDENHKGKVDTIYRSYKGPLHRLVEEFGEALLELDPSLKDHLKDSSKEYEVIHAIEPRDKYDPTKLDPLNMPFSSCYVLKELKKVIKESGFRTFPYPVPRWTKISGEKYGRSPGMKCLPDIKMINKMMQVTIRSAQKIVDPPLLVPDDGVTLPFRTTPGSINYYRAGTNDRIGPLETGARIDFGFQIMEDTRTRIRSAYFIDQLQLREGPQMTATEVMQRTEEQLRLLGPILGRQHDELLKPLIERVFDILNSKQLLPPPPEVLQGTKVDVQYSSMIARAQKTAELDSLNRFFGLASPILTIAPEAVDNFNSDSALRYIANSLSLPYEMLRDDTEVKELREQRQQAQQAAAQQQQEMVQADNMSKMAPLIKQG